MKLRIHGKTYDETFDVTAGNRMAERVGLTVEIHNRDNPGDQWEVEVIKEAGDEPEKEPGDEK